MNFADVTDIVIPQGEVIKIHETATGRVLWEKVSAIELNPQWYKINSSAFYYGLQSGGYLECIGKQDSNGTIFAAVNSMQPSINSVTNTYKACWSTFESKTSISISSKIKYKFSASAGPDPGAFKIISVPELITANNGIALAATVDGDTHTITSYLFIWGDIFGSKPNQHYINTEPVDDTSVFITYSPERSEYLVTGLKKGLCVIPTTLARNGAAFQDDFTYSFGIPQIFLRRTKWVADLNMYFGATGTDGKVYYSSDGITWNSKQVLSGNVLGIEYLSKQKKLIAISNNSAQIALSSDGMNWTTSTVPFSAALAYAYDSDNDVLCVVDKTKSYVSCDLENWTETAIPGGEQVDFRTMIYLGGGVFIANSYRKNKLYVLSLVEPIEIDSEWVAS